MRTRGFTIVELLIVIVVIGIIAAIVGSTFANAQKRARDAQMSGALKAYVSAMMRYAQVNGSYPEASTITCLGAGYTSTARCHSGADLNESASVEAMLEPYIGETRPQPPLTLVGGVRGIVFNNSASYGGHYFLYNHESGGMCPSIGNLKHETYSAEAGGTSQCRRSLPQL